MYSKGPTLRAKHVQTIELLLEIAIYSRGVYGYEMRPWTLFPQ